MEGALYPPLEPSLFLYIPTPPKATDAPSALLPTCVCLFATAAFIAALAALFVVLVLAAAMPYFDLFAKICALDLDAGDKIDPKPLYKPFLMGITNNRTFQWVYQKF